MDRVSTKTAQLLGARRSQGSFPWQGAQRRRWAVFVETLRGVAIRAVCVVAAARRGTTTVFAAAPSSPSRMAAPRPCGTYSEVPSVQGRYPGSQVLIRRLPEYEYHSVAVFGGPALAYRCGGSRGIAESNRRTSFPFNPPAEGRRSTWNRMPLGQNGHATRRIIAIKPMSAPPQRRLCAWRGHKQHSKIHVIA